MMLLGYLLLALALLACLHFIVDGIIAPSEHMIARMNLLRLADEVTERAKHENGAERKAVCGMIRRSAYSVVNNMPRYNISMLYFFVRQYRTRKEFRTEVGQTMRRIRDAEDVSMREIRLSIAKQADHVLAWNSMSWAYLLLPIGFTMLFFKKLQKAVSAMINVIQISDGGPGSHSGITGA